MHSLWNILQKLTVSNRNRNINKFIKFNIFNDRNMSIHSYWKLVIKYLDIKSLFMLYKSSEFGKKIVSTEYDLKKLWLLYHNPHIIYIDLYTSTDIMSYHHNTDCTIYKNIFDCINFFQNIIKNYEGIKITNHLIIEKINLLYDEKSIIKHIHISTKHENRISLSIQQGIDTDLDKKYTKCHEENCEYCQLCKGYNKFYISDLDLRDI